MAVSFKAVSALVLLGILSICCDRVFAADHCICDEKAALEIQRIRPHSTTNSTVTVLLDVGLENREQCICCPNVTLAYRYCAWSNIYAIPENLTDAEITKSLPWSSWMPQNPLCLKRPLTISIANLSRSNYFMFQVAPLSTSLGPTTGLVYYGHQENPVIQGNFPTTFRVNDNVSIPCEATGSPRPAVYWTKDLFSCDPRSRGHQLGNILRFDRIQLHDACTYTCLAKNQQLDNGMVNLFYDQMSVVITVIAVEPSPSISSTSTALSTAIAPANSEPTLSATATASPPVTNEGIMLQVIIPLAVFTLLVFSSCGLCLLISLVFACKKHNMARPLYCLPLKDLPCHIPTINKDYYFQSYIGDDANRIHRIPTEKLQLVRTIGEGKFATVCCAWARDVPNAGERIMVAVKELKSTVGVTNEVLKTLYHEAKLMCRLDHEHIVKFYGINISQDRSVPTMLVYEYMEEGDLRSFLLRKAEVKCTSGSQRRRCFSTSTGYDDVNAGLRTDELVEVCLQVARGMQYLAEQGQVHRDLAARNCLVGKNLRVKVGDLGMGQCLYGKNYYKMIERAYVPVRWMPPEALLKGIFSQSSDVWSFGVLMWEVFTFGRVPYAGKTNDEVFQLLLDQNAKHVSVSLVQPSLCPGVLYNIMRNCWSIQKEDRPSFQSLVDELNYWLIHRCCSSKEFETTV